MKGRTKTMVTMRQVFNGKGEEDRAAAHMVAGTCCPLAITYLFCYYA
jgi:hypothetical protein